MVIYETFTDLILLVLFACVIGLHAVQNGNNWMRKMLRTAKIGGRGVGRVQFLNPRDFFTPIISKLDSK